MDSATAAKRKDEDGSLTDEEPSEAELELCRRLCKTVMDVLDEILAAGYTTAPHPLGEPSMVFLYTSDCIVSIYNFQRTSVMEYITRVNFTIGLGYFSFDSSDGELRFCVVQHNVPGLADDRALIGALIQQATYAMSLHCPYFEKVMSGEMDARRAAQAYGRELKSKSEVCCLMLAGYGF